MIPNIANSFIWKTPWRKERPAEPPPWSKLRPDQFTYYQHLLKSWRATTWWCHYDAQAKALRKTLEQKP